MFQLYKDLFGIAFQSKEIKAKNLPLFITSGRSFFKLTTYGVEFLLIKINKEESFGVVALDKQLRLVCSKLGMPVAFGYASVSKAQRDSLVERNIPFISDSGQLYLPFLGMVFCNNFIQQKTINAQKMMPATQALFLFLLLKSGGRQVKKKQAAEYLGITGTSITRASEQLSSMNLISQQKHGTESLMSLNGKGIESYRKAKPFLINPVQRVITVRQNEVFSSYTLSGESALASKTMLNDSLIPTYAIYKSDIDLNSMKQVDIKWNPDVKAVNIELWKYNPALFSRDGIADPVSLSMCFEDNADERIEGALADYLEEYEW